MRLRHVLLPLLTTLALAACHGRDESAQVGGSTPQAAVQGSIDLLRVGDFKGLWRHALPPADYATLRADWRRRNASQPPPDALEQAKFAATVQELTAPDAQDKLYAQLQPKLTAMAQQYKDQLPVLVAMGGAYLKNGVTRNQALDDEQRAQAASLIDALTPWAQQAPWFDPDHAKQAVAAVVATARKLDLKNADTLRTMDFDTAMGKLDTGYTGLKQVLAIYGLPVDEALASARPSTLSSQGDHAVVKVDYTLLGKPLSAETRVVKQDGRWYSEALIRNVREAHARLLQAGAGPDQPPAGNAASAH